MDHQAEEDSLLRTVTLQTAQSILLARRRAEEELVLIRAELERTTRELTEFFDNAAVGLHQIGADGTIQRANRTALELLGYTREEYVGRNIAEFHADRPVIDDMMRRLTAGAELRDYEARMRCRNGSVKLIMINSNGVWENGEFIHARCFLRDITADKQAEDAQGRLAAIVESSHDAIISKTLSGRIVSWNPEAERLFGYTAAEAVGQPITMLIPTDRLAEEESIIARLRKGERIEEHETVRLSKQGERLEVSLSVSPVLDAAGRVIGASKILRDVTARRRVELAIRRSEATTRFLADASAALAELTDFETTMQRLVELSVPAFADWCAFDVQESDGTIRRLAVQHADPARLELVQELFRHHPPRLTDSRGIAKVLETGRSDWSPELPDAMLAEAAYDAEHLELMRQLRLKSYICTPIVIQNMRAVLSFVTAESGRVYDATDLAVAEDLAHRAAIAIENASLVRALQQADTRKDEFLAILAHELRNPLAPIRNAAQILRAKGPPIPELQWAREVIDRQVLQMTRLVDDLLDVSRITKGKIELRRERLELSTLVSSAVEASRPLLKKWGHDLSISIPPEPIYLDADPTRMDQVLLNLLNNAAKYTEQGGRIALTAALEGAEVVIRITDNGVGIPPDVLPRIFEMFMQVDRSLERSQGGLGIGLTLVQLLVEMHGGTVRAHSEGTGLGSEFIVRLPAAPQRAGPGREKVATAPGARAEISQSLRVLVVDDNQDAAESLAILLRHAGCDVRTAHDGLEAVGAAAVFRPDVAILDLGLPGLNGYDVGRRIRKDLGAGVLLIAATGWGQEEDRRRTAEAGFNYHLTKPVELDELRRLLASVRSARPL